MEKNKFKKNNQANKKTSKNFQSIIPHNIQSYISKNRVSSYPLDLTKLSEQEFIKNATKYFFDDIIYKNYFSIGELFTLNKNSSYNNIQKINILLEELNKNEYKSPRAIFFQSPPMIGMSYITRYFNQNNFKFFLFSHSFGADNKKQFKKYLSNEQLCSDDFKDGSISSLFEKIFSIMNEQNRIDNKTFFIVFKNLPYQLYLMALKDIIGTPNFIKNWKVTLVKFLSEINDLLNRNESNVKLIFFTDDQETDEYDLKKIFDKSIIDNSLTKIIICNPIIKRKMLKILQSFNDALNPKIIDDNNFNYFAESIYLEFNSNIQQILDHLLLKVTSGYYHRKGNKKHILSQNNRNQKSQSHKRINEGNGHSKSQNRTKNKISNKENIKDFQIKKEKLLDNDIFRLLGKLLYNKRLVIEKNSIEKLKKEEFKNNFETPRYYNIDELIDEIPISTNTFNDLLINNSIDHFNDIREYSDTYDLYSFTDTIDNFNSFLYDKNNQYYNSNKYMRTYLNCLGITTYNLSQYNNATKFNPKLSEKGMIIIKKQEKYEKNKNKFKDNTYYNACEHYPCVISLSLFIFYKEGIVDIYKNFFDINNRNIKTKDNKKINDGDINCFYKEKMLEKFFGINDEEFNDTNHNNKSNLNSTPKEKKIRNIPEEDKKAFDSFLNEADDDESDTENEIEE